MNIRNLLIALMLFTVGTIEAQTGTCTLKGSLKYFLYEQQTTSDLGSVGA